MGIEGWPQEPQVTEQREPGVKTKRRSRSLGPVLVAALSLGSAGLARAQEPKVEDAVSAKEADQAREAKELESKIQKEFFRVVDALRRLAEDSSLNILEIRDSLTELVEDTPVFDAKVLARAKLPEGDVPAELPLAEWGPRTYVTQAAPEDGEDLELAKLEFKSKPHLILPMGVQRQATRWAQDKLRFLYRSYDDIETIGPNSLDWLVSDTRALAAKFDQRISLTSGSMSHGPLWELIEQKRRYEAESPLYSVKTRNFVGPLPEDVESPSLPPLEGYAYESSTGEWEFAFHPSLSKESAEAFELKHPGHYRKENGLGVFRLPPFPRDFAEIPPVLNDLDIVDVESNYVSIFWLDSIARTELNIPKEE